MSKRKFQFYLFAGKTVISTKNISSLKGLLPNEVDIVRRGFLSERLNKDFVPYVVELTEEQGKDFIDEMVRKLGKNSKNLSKYLYLKPYGPKSIINPIVAKIVINIENSEKYRR